MDGDSKAKGSYCGMLVVARKVLTISSGCGSARCGILIWLRVVEVKATKGGFIGISENKSRTMALGRQRSEDVLGLVTRWR